MRMKVVFPAPFGAEDCRDLASLGGQVEGGESLSGLEALGEPAGFNDGGHVRSPLVRVLIGVDVGPLPRRGRTSCATLPCR